jgi:type II secretory pathway pseudopilin PulG
MKLRCAKTGTWHGRRAFTLLEVLVASVTLVIIVGSVIMCNLFGLSMAARQQIWLGASSDAAQAVSQLMSDIRAANSLKVGSYSVAGGFVPTASTGQQSGNALEVFPTTNTVSPVTIYYYDSTSNNLVVTNWGGYTGNFKMVSANPITNDGVHAIFTEVDYTGTPLTNYTPVAAISIYMSFNELQNPQIKIESGSAVDLYQIMPIVSPRIRL